MTVDPGNLAMPDPGGPAMPGAPFATPEFALVVAATRWPIDDDQVGRLRVLAARVRCGARVIEIVDRHRVAGLVHFALERAAAPLPEPWRGQLAERARDNAVGEMKLLAETLRLSALFDAGGIAHKVVKGIVAALAVFGRFGLRYSLDIDLVVAPADVAAAARLLRGAGYVRTEPDEAAGPAEMRGRLARHKDFVFEHAASGTIVELHWRLFANCWIYPQAEDARSIALELVPGRAVPTLPAAVAQLYLCFHGSEHAWARLKWLADLGAIIAGDAGAAAALYDRARAMGRHRLVGPGLLLCHRCYGHMPPPRLVADLARDWRMRALARTASASLVGDEDGIELEARPLATTRKNLAHYLVVNDPRHILSELRYDLLFRDEADDDGSRIARLASRLWRLRRGAGRAAPPA